MGKMHLLALTTSACLLVKMSEAAVAVGVGRLNPENPSECLDPDTGLNHTLGVAWNIPGVCGQAHCELRNQQVYISYAFCGSAQAEAPCYLSSTDLSLPYPYCCPRSICPARLDVHTNLIDTDDYEDELQGCCNMGGRLPGPSCSSTELCRSPSRGGREQKSGKCNPTTQPMTAMMLPSTTPIANK